MGDSTHFESTKPSAVGSLHLREGPMDFLALKNQEREKQTGTSPGWAWAGWGSRILEAMESLGSGLGVAWASTSSWI